MSPEAARFLLDLLSRQTLSVGAPDFDETVAVIQRARDELAAQLSPSDQAMHSP